MLQAFVGNSTQNSNENGTSGGFVVASISELASEGYADESGALAGVRHFLRTKAEEDVAVPLLPRCLCRIELCQPLVVRHADVDCTGGPLSGNNEGSSHEISHASNFSSASSIGYTSTFNARTQAIPGTHVIAADIVQEV